MNEWSSPTSHKVTTRLRSMPFGRGGAGGTSPLAMRSVQSAIGLERSLLALIGEHAVHRRAADAGAEPPFPGLRVRLELGLRLQDVVDVARQRVAELMTEVAVGFERVDPVVLGQHVRSEPVALRAGAGKFLCGRRLEQRQPVIARIDLRRFLRRFGQRRGQRDLRRGRLHLDRRRIDEAVASDPHAIGGGGQFRHHEAALIVGDDNLDEVGGQVLGFGDDPHAGFRPLAAAHDAGDVARWARSAPDCSALLESTVDPAIRPMSATRTHALRTIEWLDDFIHTSPQEWIDTSDGRNYSPAGAESMRMRADAGAARSRREAAAGRCRQSVAPLHRSWRRRGDAGIERLRITSGTSFAGCVCPTWRTNRCSTSARGTGITPFTPNTTAPAASSRSTTTPGRSTFRKRPPTWRASSPASQPIRAFHTVPELWDPVGLPGKRGFDLAYRLRNSRADVVVDDFMTMDVQRLGTFDVVLFLGVIYHLEEPLRALRRLRQVTRGVAVIESEAVVLPEFVAQARAGALPRCGSSSMPRRCMTTRPSGGSPRRKVCARCASPPDSRTPRSWPGRRKARRRTIASSSTRSRDASSGVRVQASRRRLKSGAPAPATAEPRNLITAAPAPCP